MTNERAIDALLTVRAYYASLTADYPKGKDRKGIGDVMCSEIANACLMASKLLESQPCEDAISRERLIILVDEGAELHPYKVVGDSETYSNYNQGWTDAFDWLYANIESDNLPSVQPTKKGKWIHIDNMNNATCSICGIKAHASYNFCPICGADMRGDADED